MPTSGSKTATVKKATGAVKTSSKAKRTMSDSHKAALAAGRDQTRAVSAYLAAIGSTRKRRGRQVTVESLQARLDKAVSELADDPTPIDRLNLSQQIKNLQRALEGKKAPADVDLPKLEEEFVRVAKGYAENRGITRGTWLENGVEKRVLEAAGI